MQKKKAKAKKLRELADKNRTRQPLKTAIKAARGKIPDEDPEAQALERERYLMGTSLASPTYTLAQIDELLKKAKK